MELKALDNNELETRLRELLESSRRLEIDILLTLVEIRRRNIDNALGYVNLYDYCQDRFGFTRAQAVKRSQAARTIEFFPETINLLKEGKTHVSHLALLAPKITQANKDKILNFLPGASKRSLEFFLQRIDFGGNEVDVTPTIEVKLKCSQEMLEKLEHLQGLLAQSHGKSNKENVVDKALDVLLEKVDPVRKDERREQRLKKKIDKIEPKKVETHSPGETLIKRYIPESIKASVRKRDGYRCTFKSHEGRRCYESAALQIDHIQPWSLNGNHDLENLRLLCPAHNRYQALKVLGKSYHQEKRIERNTGSTAGLRS